MPTAQPWASRLSEVAISTDGTTYSDVERLRNPRYSGSTDTTETSSNDSSGHKEFIPTWTSGTLTFEVVAEETATVQEALWLSYINKTRLFYRLRPKGNATTEKEIIQQGYLTSIEENLDRGAEATYSFTIQLTGAPTRQNQA